VRPEVLQEEAVLCASKEVFANEPISRAERSLLMAYKVGVNCRRRQRSVDCNATVVLLTDLAADPRKEGFMEPVVVSTITD
jgi:hypothetical protein